MAITLVGISGGRRYVRSTSFSTHHAFTLLEQVPIVKLREYSMMYVHEPPIDYRITRLTQSRQRMKVSDSLTSKRTEFSPWSHTLCLSTVCGRRRRLTSNVREERARAPRSVSQLSPPTTDRSRTDRWFSHID